MNIALMQTTLARLIIDAAAFRTFLSDRALFLDGIQFSAEERAIFEGIDAGDIEQTRHVIVGTRTVSLAQTFSTTASLFSQQDWNDLILRFHDATLICDGRSREVLEKFTGYMSATHPRTLSACVAEFEWCVFLLSRAVRREAQLDDSRRPVNSSASIRVLRSRFPIDVLTDPQGEAPYREGIGDHLYLIFWNRSEGDLSLAEVGEEVFDLLNAFENGALSLSALANKLAQSNAHAPVVQALQSAGMWDT